METTSLLTGSPLNHDVDELIYSKTEALAFMGTEVLYVYPVQSF